MPKRGVTLEEVFAKPLEESHPSTRVAVYIDVYTEDLHRAREVVRIIMDQAMPGDGYEGEGSLEAWEFATELAEKWECAVTEEPDLIGLRREGK
jgi:hypothetical protein